MNETEIKEGTQPESTLARILNFKIGILPLGVYLFLLLTVFLVLNRGLMTKDILGGMALMSLYGYTCAEIGKRIPLLKYVGGTVIMATFLPSYLVYAHMIPTDAIATIKGFM